MRESQPSKVTVVDAFPLLVAGWLLIVMLIGSIFSSAFVGISMLPILSVSRLDCCKLLVRLSFLDNVSNLKFENYRNASLNMSGNHAYVY